MPQLGGVLGIQLLSVPVRRVIRSVVQVAAVPMTVLPPEPPDGLAPVPPEPTMPPVLTLPPDPVLPPAPAFPPAPVLPPVPATPLPLRDTAAPLTVRLPLANP